MSAVTSLSPAEYARIDRKVYCGKTLTAREQARWNLTVARKWQVIRDSLSRRP